MKPKKRIRISQCMIVKNEEANIEKALSWGKSVMWEQIVVDTGSTDGTAELAKKLGAKVFFFDWINDFAAAKNYAIEQAKGDWIAFFDADEYMVLQDARDMYRVLEGLAPNSYNAISTGCQNLDDEGKVFSSGTQIRIFRNTPDIRYRRRIHEQLVSLSGKELFIGDISNEISFFHTGYQKKALEGKEKKGRNRKLIQEELEKDPKDHEMLGYMGDECFGDGEICEAKKWYQKSIEQMPLSLPDYDQRSAYTFTQLLTILVRQWGNPGENLQENISEELRAVYGQAVKRLPKEGDFDYILGKWYAGRNQAEKAAEHLKLAINKLETYGCYNKALLLAGNLLEVYGLLARCCYETGEIQTCISYSVTYLKYDKYGMAVLSRLMKALIPCERGEEPEADKGALELFMKLYDSSSLKDRLFLIKTAEKSGCIQLAGFLAEQLCSPEERMSMGL
ncbi:MAG: glycosyltransferase family 2 protein [Lachnospiraceae bacterium]|nr:glycosyltransferase family 2 protein [Lachnospiraceae bacterium]